ncbi:TMEM207 isoform 1 [Pan troglodytes]|uniref:TMEM207 isoform 1 n=2 Tax=Pan troglodytes TaxID=9598 RepID=A0A6D2VWX2_PANTR|nr:transmembrane protein 207 isoform X2 [Pan troglodytes]PNI55014.1 TMEM207 isoform 1 [Pan troglodytes]
MSRSRLFSVTSAISTIGILCLPLFQLVLSDLPCEEDEMCVSYNDQHPDGWYIWILLLLVLVAALLCGAVVLCLQCWLRRPRIDFHRRTMAVFAVGDLDSIYGTEAAVSPTVGIHLQTQTPDLYPVPAPCFGPLGSPPPYEEILKTT